MTAKSVVSQTSLKVNFARHGKRPAKSQTFLRGSKSHPLRWNASFPAILSKIESEGAVAKANALVSPQQSLSSSGSHHDHDLYHGRWDETNLGYSNPSLQRIFSISAGIEQLSGRFDSEEIPEGFEYARDRRVETYPRYVAAKDVPFAQSSQQPDLRFGFYGSSSVWLANRGSQRGLQSQEAGTTQLSSAVVFSWIYAGLLAWHLAFGRHARLHRGSGILGTMSPEDSQVSLSDSPASGFRILRSQIHRTSRRSRNRLRHRSRYDQTHQRAYPISALSNFSQSGGLAGGQIYLSTQQVEPTSSVHRDSPSQVGRRESIPATHTVAIQRLLLPYSGKQSPLERSSGVAILHQAMPGRVGHSGAQREFSIEQNSNQQLLGQSSVFSFDSFGLRFDQLVQTSLPAATVVFGYFANDSYGHVLPGRSFGEFWRQKSTQASKSVSPSETLRSGSQEYRTLEDSQKPITLSKTHKRRSPSCVLKHGYSPFFQVKLSPLASLCR